MVFVLKTPLLGIRAAALAKMVSPKREHHRTVFRAQYVL